MKKIFISSLLIITSFWGESFPDNEQQKALKEIVKKYGEATIVAVEEKTRDKEKIDSCQKYLDKADKALNEIEKRITFEAEQAYSLYANSLMKRYEICLGKYK